jgi:signal transduction histidine kinase
VGRMRSAATRMQNLIDGLLTLSRITTRAQNFETVDLREVVDEVVSDLEIQIEQAEGLVEVGKLPAIQADRLQMRQLLQNLIANALKFRRPDTAPVVKVQGRFVKGRRQRSVGQSVADELCSIVVSDNGIGFDEKYADRIFDVFQRLHPRDVYEGTGVGLAICRKIAERHGGSIVVKSEPGQGSTFEIVLPVIHPRKKK